MSDWNGSLPRHANPGAGQNPRQDPRDQGRDYPQDDDYGYAQNAPYSRDGEYGQDDQYRQSSSGGQSGGRSGQGGQYGQSGQGGQYGQGRPPQGGQYGQGRPPQGGQYGQGRPPQGGQYGQGGGGQGGGGQYGQGGYQQNGYAQGGQYQQNPYQQGQYAAGPQNYGQQQYYGQQPRYAPPPKKSHWVRNTILTILAVLILGGGAACTAIVLVAGDAVNDAIEADSAPGGPQNPMDIQVGKAFEVSGFTYAKGWKLRKDALGSFEVTKLKVTNNRDLKDSALVEIKMWKGDEVVGLLDCSTNPIDVGSTVSLTCLSTDDFTKSYDRVTINDTF